MKQHSSEAIVIRPYQPALSPTGRLLGWMGLPWAIGVLFAGDALLGLTELPRGERPALLRALLILVALVPIALYVASPWLGRLRAMAWLLAKPQPEVVIDPEGVRLSLPDRAAQRVPWSAVAALQPANDIRGSSVLLGVDGQVLATVPQGLVYPRGRGLTSRSLAQYVVAMRPDRYVLSGTNWAGVPDRFVHREMQGTSGPYKGSSKRRLAVLGGITLILLGIGVVAAIVWLQTG